jgi:DNA repair protein RadC
MFFKIEPGLGEKTMEQKEENPKHYVREVTAKYIGPRRASMKICDPREAAQFVRSILRDEAREHFIALYLNGAHAIISFSIVSIGTATSAPAHPREVFQPAILIGACALIVAHNHPSGELTPSAQDQQVTRRLKEASQILSIKLLDHLIVAGDSYYSFQQEGCLDELGDRSRHLAVDTAA